MNMIGPSLSSDIMSATHSSAWMAEVQFKKSESASENSPAVSIKDKYKLLRPGGQQVNGVVRPAVAVNHNTCKSDPVNGFVAKEVAADEISCPKIQIESAESVSIEWQKIRAIGAGLVNMGNTCFMNSVLQCLTYCPPLVNYLMFRKNDHSESVCSGFCFACLLLENMRRCFQSPGGVVRPQPIAQRLKSVARQFQFGRQEDAHEYLRHAIDCMCKSSVTAYERKHPNVKLDPVSKETTAFNHIFGGYLRSQVTCSECKSRSNTYDHFMDLMLDVKNASSVETALEKFTKPEHLQHENAYKCPKCKKKGQATKRFTIHRPPNVLTIQLKRFEFNRFTGKITKHIQFPEFLDLRPFMSDTTGDRLMYQLSAVLVHHGASCNSGHYFAFVRNSNKCWYKMDDERVSSTGLHQVLGQNAYILFYIKKTGSPAPVSTGQATVRTPTPVPVPSLGKMPHLIPKKTAAALPHPFSIMGNRNSLLSSGTTPLTPKGPHLICEPATRKSVPANGTTSNHVKSQTLLKPVSLNNVKKLAPKNLVPYSDDEDDDNDDGKDEKVMKPLSNGRCAAPIGSDNQGTVKADRKPGALLETVRASGLTNSSKAGHENNGFELMRLQNQTLQSFGSNVTGWDGEQNRLDQRLERDKRVADAMNEDDLYNMEYDTGKMKKVKTSKLVPQNEHENGKNPFDLFRHEKPDFGRKNKSFIRSVWPNKFAGGRGGHSGWKNRSQKRAFEYRAFDMDEPMASQASSRASSRNSGRSPMPPPSGHGVTMNRPLGLSSASMYQPSSGSGFSTMPRPGRDYSCPPPARSAFSSRRSSSGVFITSMFGSRFRHLQKLHSDAFVLGLNAVCFPGLPVGTMFRSSLPATPVSTPIHRDVFSHFTEQALRDRLCKTPSPRKVGLRFSPLDTDPCLSLQEDVSERVDSGSSDHAMDITPCPSTPIEET